MTYDSDEILEHYGKKGMKWGVRQQNRLDASKRVAEGTGTKEDRNLVLANQSVISLIRNKGVTGAAAKDAARLQLQKERIESGKATAIDLLNNIGGFNLFTVGN
jgi:hypothetical protein